jgi:Zn-dependent protease with chaperone function
MSDAATFVRDCLASGAIFTSLCALLTVPFIIVLSARALAPRIAAMHHDPLWQAPLAAATAALPGLVFLAIAAYGLIAGWGSTCMQFATGRALYGAIAITALVAFARASLAVGREVAHVRALISASRPASLRLSLLGREAGVEVRELETAMPFFALAGVLRPVVLVSSATLRGLSDSQIAAALRHEAAHHRRRDALLSTALLFVSRLFPVSVAGLADVYHAAREAAADHVARRSANPLDLAGAITAMARAHYALTPALSGNGDVQSRVRVLLAERPYAADTQGRTFALSALILMAFVGMAPLWLPALHIFTCNGAMSQ